MDNQEMTGLHGKIANVLVQKNLISHSLAQEAADAILPIILAEIAMLREAVDRSINALEFLADFEHWDEEEGEESIAMSAIEKCKKALNHGE